MTDNNAELKFCGRCDGATQRYASGKCKACVKEYNIKWQSENKGYAAIYRAQNPESTKAAQQNYKESHKEEIKKATKEARARDPERFRAYSRKHYHLNRSAALQKGRDWKAKNVDRVRKSHSDWTSSNLAAIRAYAARRRALHPNLDKIYWQNRRARKIGNGGALSVGLAATLFKLQRGKCACCKLPLGDDYHMDHIMPLALGGPNSDENMQLLRKRCNLQKQASHPVDFMRRRGFLL